MAILTVEGLVKRYPGFTLDAVSFSLEEGSIMGFLGRNGAGKTTTLSCLLDLVHPDAGEIRFFGRDSRGAQREIKERVGFVSGGFDCYPRKKLKTITGAVRPCYRGWQESAYHRWLSLFALDEEKTPAQLSAGMRVKYALALALSHGARLLILDEPTSGLDPVSREELLGVFRDLARQEEVAILFSTHITSDLEKCADSLTYLKQGQLRYTGSLADYRALHGNAPLQDVMVEEELGRKPL